MNDLDNLRAELEKTPRRGGWSDYLRKNYFAFKATIADQRPVDWAVIAAWAQKNGHTGKGDPAPPISAGACRKAFERERASRGDGRQPKPAAVSATKPRSDLSSVVRMLPLNGADRPDRIAAQLDADSEARQKAGDAGLDDVIAAMNAASRFS